MKDFLTVLSYIAVFAFLLKRAADTGVVDGTIMLLLVPFLVRQLAETWGDGRRAMRICAEGSEADDDE